MPSKLYGRQAEAKALQQAYARVYEGRHEMVLKGFQGFLNGLKSRISRTAVVEEFSEEVLAPCAKKGP